MSGSEMTARIYVVGKTAFRSLKMRPCPSILCQRIQCPEPDISYLKALESRNGCPLWQAGHTFPCDNAI